MGKTAIAGDGMHTLSRPDERISLEDAPPYARYDCPVLLND